jgi:4'-phosphopantetheinyl transferase
LNTLLFPDLEPWEPAPIDVPPLPPGEMHLWRTVVWNGPDGEPLPEASRVHLLSRSETDRLRRFRRTRDQVQFCGSRAFLRIVLGKYLGVGAEEVRFTQGQHGKPELDRDWLTSPLQFNLTHADELAIVGVSLASPVGVDLERVHGLSDLEPLVRRCLTPEEAKLLDGLEHHQRSKGFLRLWSRKEALLKGLGLGLVGDLSQIAVWDAGAPTWVKGSQAVREQDLDDWRLIDLTPSPGYVGAAALHGAGDRVRYFVYESR